MRLLKHSVALVFTLVLAACGGNSECCSSGKVTSFPNAILTNEVPRLVVGQSDSNYHEFSELHFTFTSENYFKENPTGHAALLMRTLGSQIATKLEGVGMIFGNVSLASNTIPGNPATEPNTLFPSIQIETWFHGHDTQNFLLAPINPAIILEDNINYDIVIKSHIKEDKSIQTEQILIYKMGDLIWDSGVVTDPNKYIVPTYNDIAIGHVFDNPNAKPWKITFSNIVLVQN